MYANIIFDYKTKRKIMITYKQIPTQYLKDKTEVIKVLLDFGISQNHLIYLRKALPNILVNNTPSTVRALVSKNDILLINANPGTKTGIKPIELPLDIVYEDEDVLLVNKPSGISTMANRSHYTNNLAGGIVFYCSKNDPNFILRIVNRLDKDTQGLVLVAKNLVVYKCLFDTSKKVYHAVLKGKIENAIEVHSPILELIENGRINLKRVVAENGKPASTYISPIQKFENHTLCEIEIVFGRTHQIRVHSSSIGFPLEGDYIYDQPSTLISHTALVCKKLSFYHPTLKQEMIFEIDYEDSFKNLLKNIIK